MLHYVTLGSNDITRSKAFYDAAMKPLGVICNYAGETELGYGPVPKSDEAARNYVWVGKPYMKLPATWGNGAMIAFKAESRGMVDAFYAAAMKAGGIDEGAPGLRPYHASFYSCYVRDPDGNKLSAVCEKPEA
jgi:catechol 2,3-dioxygenase-like lactoylglutathione lyase family enzyme